MFKREKIHHDDDEEENGSNEDEEFEDKGDDKINWDDFSETKPNRQLGLKVENKIYWVSREGLADLSPTFMAMLYGPFEESKKDIVELKDKKSDEILELLRRLFPTNGEFKKVNMKNVVVLLKLSDEYEIKFLLDECKDIIKKDIAFYDDVDYRPSWPGDKKVAKMIEWFVLAVQHNLKQIVRALFPFIRRFGSKEIESYFDVLPKEVKKAFSIPMAERVKKNTDDQVIHEMGYPDDGNVKCSECRDKGADEQCVYCPFAKCSKRQCNKKSEYYYECDGCRLCKNTSPRNGKKQEECQCINPLAIVELEKLGL